MSETIVVKTKPCTVCGEYEVWSLDRQAVTKWQEGEMIQNAFPDMSMADREILISGTHPACWDKLFPEEEGVGNCAACNSWDDSLEAGICQTCISEEH